MANANLESKRALLRKEQARATRKIGRIKAGVQGVPKQARHLAGEKIGIDITGTKHDPRVDSARIGRMTERQVDRALDRLREFNNSKSVSFFRGSTWQSKRQRELNGPKEPPIISRRAWVDAINATDEANRQTLSFIESNKHRTAPWAGTKNGGEPREFGEFAKPGRGGVPALRTYPSPANASSEEGMRVLAKSIRKNEGPQGRMARISGIRKNVDRFFDQNLALSPELRTRINNLDDDILEFLWQSSPHFVENLVFAYPSDEEVPEDIQSGAVSNLESQISHAEKLQAAKHS